MEWDAVPRIGFYEQGETKVRMRSIRTPEGLTLEFRVGGLGDRLAALILDLLMIFAGILALILLLVFAARAGGEIAMSIALVVFFFLRNFYFTYFEMKRSGTTPGKKRLRLRVIARDGGPLTSEMVIVRNLMRELEVFLPVMVLLAPEAVVGSKEGWVTVVTILWVFVFALVPFFGPDRLRCGDLVAGTIVVFDERASLLRDLAIGSRETRMADAAVREEYVFTPEQLDLYGVKELQILEDLLRKAESGAVEWDVLREVCNRIIRKIGWAEESRNVDVKRFLRAFYAAQRSRLEQGLVMGKRKEEKTKKVLRKPPSSG